MNKTKKIEILSTALAVEIKVLLAYHYSDEEIVHILKFFLKDTKKLIRALFIKKLMQICKGRNLAQTFYISLKLYHSYKQMQAELPTLVEESFKLLREKVDGLFNVEAPLSLNGALAAIIDDEICTILSNTSFAKRIAWKGRIAKKY